MSVLSISAFTRYKGWISLLEHHLLLAHMQLATWLGWSYPFDVPPHGPTIEFYALYLAQDIQLQGPCLLAYQLLHGVRCRARVRTNGHAKDHEFIPAHLISRRLFCKRLLQNWYLCVREYVRLMLHVASVVYSARLTKNGVQCAQGLVSRNRLEVQSSWLWTRRARTSHSWTPSPASQFALTGLYWRYAIESLPDRISETIECAFTWECN